MTRVRAPPTCTGTCHVHGTCSMCPAVACCPSASAPTRCDARRRHRAHLGHHPQGARRRLLCAHGSQRAPSVPVPTRRTLHAARSGLAPRPRGGQSARPCGFPARPSPPTHTVAPHGQLRLSLRPAVGQVANDMAHDQFCETTIGYKVPSRRPPRRPPRRPLPGLLPASSAVGALPSRLCFCVRLRSGLGAAHLLLPRLGGRTTPTVSSSRRPSTARLSRWASSRTRWAWSCAAL